MSRKLKLVVNAIPAANPVTGIGRYILELYEAMHELAGTELDIHYFDGRSLSRNPPTGPTNLKRFSQLGRLFWSLPLPIALSVRTAHHWHRERLFRRLSEGMDVYHETAFFPFQAMPGVKTVQTVHDLSLQFHPEWHPQERVAYARRYFKPRLKWASSILTVSDFTRDELLRFEPDIAERIVVTPLGVGRAFRPASAEECKQSRARYKLPENFLLFVGSGDPRKNTRIVAEVLARRNVHCELVCVGWSGWLTDAMNGNARMLGYVPDQDLPALYSSAKAFVFPSMYEGFGLPVLEAMACGCPVVVPNAHTMPELAGDAGFYYGLPADADRLEQCLIEIVAQEGTRQRLINAGFRRARQFDWKRTAELTLSAFETSLRRSKANLLL